MNESCKTCRFYREGKTTESEMGTCRKNPPSFQEPVIFVREDWWCGEFQPLRQSSGPKEAEPANTTSTFTQPNAHHSAHDFYLQGRKDAADAIVNKLADLHFLGSPTLEMIREAALGQKDDPDIKPGT